jgi:hypothetical protein
MIDGTFIDLNSSSLSVQSLNTMRALHICGNIYYFVRNFAPLIRSKTLNSKKHGKTY